MTAAELLRPRYEIIADFPGNGYNVGRIIVPIIRSGKIFDCLDAPSSEVITNPEKYPHLFRKMSWWENRDLKDMPGYVMFHDKTIFKIKSWHLEQLTGVIDNDEDPGYICLTIWNYKAGYGYIPIGESLAIRQLAKSKNKD